MSSENIIVNSWNEWDPLKHVIVGKADGTCIPAPEPALDAKVTEDSDMRGQFGPRTKDSVDKANQLLDDFSNMLIKRGIKVDRPDPINFNQKTSTPDWETETMFGCMPPRDVLLTVGNEILEATMSYRCRWFEYLCYRPLLKQYYNSDPNMKHESAPKPRLTDLDYRKDYLSDKIGIQKRLEWTDKKFFVTTEEEPLFDAADILRFGKDLVVQHGFTTNLKGIDWIKRHYKDHRVHAVNFPGDPYPIHIDATFTPIKEGIIIPGDGASYYDTEFELLTFKPELQEVILGGIRDIADFGVFMTIGPTDGMIHVSQTMDDYVSFSKDKSLLGKESKKSLKVGDKCVARIIAISFKEAANPKIGLTMRQPGLGRIDWIREEAQEKTKKPKSDSTEKKGDKNKK